MEHEKKGGEMQVVNRREKVEEDHVKENSNDQSGSYIKIKVDSCKDNAPCNNNTTPCDACDLTNYKEIAELQEKINLRTFVKIRNLKEKISVLRFKKWSLAFMIVYITIYFFTSMALLIGNSQSQEVIETEYVLPFHSLDFWATFFFALVEGGALVAASILSVGNVRFYIVLLNIGITLVALILFCFNPEFWEPAAHWCEYTAQVCLTLSDFIFILYQFKQTNNILNRYRNIEIGIVVVLTIASVLKLLIFGEVIVFSSSPEHDAHYFEFIGEMANAVFAFMFTYILFQECSEELQQVGDLRALGENIVLDI